jgi:hypothetical protein
MMIAEHRRTCKFRETCRTRAIAYINGIEMPYEPYWFRKAIAEEIENTTNNFSSSQLNLFLLPSIVAIKVKRNNKKR